MSGKMRLMWLGMTFLGLLDGSATASNACNNENAVPVYDRLLFGNELELTRLRGEVLV
jgi:hypothetical protein